VIRMVLLYLSNAVWTRRIVENWRVAQGVSSRFVAGETLAEALAIVRGLNEKGLYTSLDHLGENVTNVDESANARDEYIHIIQSIGDLQSNVSLKLSQLGLGFDFELCLHNIRTIAERAADLGIMVRIDMEDSSTVDSTLEVFSTLQRTGIGNIGLVFQAYLYRTEGDMKDVLPMGSPVRLCKGAYNEPPEKAFPKKADVDHNFDRLAAQLIDFAGNDKKMSRSATGIVPPIAAIATHDEERIANAIEHARKIGLPKTSLEFQMLYGIRADLQSRLAAAGYPVRIYVPFGNEWYPYFMRRLAERPANLGFFISHLIRRKGWKS
jgi:proline dehydrogenase